MPADCQGTHLCAGTTPIFTKLGHAGDAHAGLTQGDAISSFWHGIISLGVFLIVRASHEGHPHFTSATHRLFSLRDTQSNRATQSSKQESDCRVLHPILKGPLALSLPSAQRRLKGSEESPAGAGKLCFSAAPTGAPSVGQGGSSPRR